MKKQQYKIDPLTGKRFLPIRSNQRFASASNRITYNNQLATKIRHKMRYINYPLLKNFKIINKLMFRKAKRVFTKDYLEGLGFDFNVITKVVVIDKKKFNTIYNYAIIPFSKNQIIIERYEIRK